MLTLGRNNFGCAHGHPGGRLDWFIGDAYPGTGKLSFDNGPPRPVPDSDFINWCATPPARTFTYTATGPRGPATRTITL